MEKAVIAQLPREAQLAAEVFTDAELEELQPFYNDYGDYLGVGFIGPGKEFTLYGDVKRSEALEILNRHVIIVLKKAGAYTRAGYQRMKEREESKHGSSWEQRIWEEIRKTYPAWDDNGRYNWDANFSGHPNVHRTTGVDWGFTNSRRYTRRGSHFWPPEPGDDE